MCTFGHAKFLMCGWGMWHRCMCDVVSSVKLVPILAQNQIHVTVFRIVNAQLLLISVKFPTNISTKYIHQICDGLYDCISDELMLRVKIGCTGTVLDFQVSKCQRLRRHVWNHCTELYIFNIWAQSHRPTWKPNQQRSFSNFDSLSASIEFPRSFEAETDSL